ncbi:MAG: lantibiotic dehydratase [Actinomycetaceae bacterium]|nr:lantibiotic dehydratase [Actinomycetaceae bacterium]
MKAIDNYTQLRLGGISQGRLQDLYHPSFANGIAKVVTAKAELSRGRDQISDALHTAIGELEQERRKSAISLRRELYKLNVSKAAAILNNIDAETRQTIDTHAPRTIDLTETIAAGTASMNEMFEDAVQWEREAISKFLNAPEFMSGLAISSPALVPAVQRLGKHVQAGAVDKDDKKAERSLHSYILRAGAKTSPFSTLGPISIVSRSGDTAGAKRVSRPSVYPIARVFNQLLTEPSKLGNLHVQISKSTREVDGEMTVERASWEFKDNNSRTDFAKCAEDTVRIQQKALTDAVGSLLGSETMKLGELATHISEGARIEVERSYEILGDLIRLGFLEIPALSFHPHDAKQLQTVAQEVRAVDEELAGAIGEYVERAERFVALNDAAQRGVEIKALQDLVSRMYELAGVSAKLPRSVAYEDVLVDANVSGASFEEEVHDDTIQKLFTLLDLLDDSNVKHALMIGYFKSRDVESIDADEFIRGFTEELFDSFESYDLASVADEDLATDPWLRWGDAWTWVFARRQLTGALTAHLINEKVGAGMKTLADLEPIDASESIADAVSAVQLFKPAFRHSNLLVQNCGDSSWVVNDAFGGIGFQISRFTHLLNENAYTYTKDIAERARNCGIKLAELSGGALFSNLNLHEPLLPEQIVLPGEPVRDSELPTISLDDLSVKLSESENRVAVYHGEVQVHPVYSGYLVPAATPQRNQILSLFTPSGQMSRKLTEIVTAKPKPGHVALIPQIRIDNLVVARARVIVPATDCPKHSPLTVAGYEEWVRFWTDRGLPMAGFVRIRDESTASNKPYFFDIRQILSCSNLHNDIRKAEGQAFLEISEVLPEQPSIEYEGEGVVSEQMVGISWMEGTQCRS